MKKIAKEIVLLLTFLLLGAIYAAPRAKASPDPLLVSWCITDAAGTPIDGAEVEIYWSTSPSGPFDAMDNSIVEDRITMVGGTYFHNPIVSGYFNKDKPAGWAVADLHITSVPDYYFYVKIKWEGQSEPNYWPKATSFKPGDETWGYPEEVVDASGCPSGYAATGNGFGNGPTTAYPTNPPPPWYIPEVPFGTVVSFLSMFTMLVGFAGVRRLRKKSP